jgi:hypothetical protein
MKETKDHCSENYKSLKREIKEDIRKWKDLPYSWIGRINNILPLHVQCNSYQNPSDIFHRDKKINPKIHMKTPKTSNRQSNSEQNV